MSRLSVCFLALALVLAVSPLTAQAQRTSDLTVQRIMQDPDTWIGPQPGSPFWTLDGDALYFTWNPGNQFPSDSLYKVVRGSTAPVKVMPQERRALAPRFTGWPHDGRMHGNRWVYSDGGDLYIWDLATDAATRLTRTSASESSARFADGGTAVVFRSGNDLYKVRLADGMLAQLTDVRDGSAMERPERKKDAQDQFLEEQQQFLFQYLREQKAEREARNEAREREQAAEETIPVFYRGQSFVAALDLDPTERWVIVGLQDQPSDRKGTIVQDYVTDSGYAEDLNARSKVGAPQGGRTLHLLDLAADTSYQIDLTTLPGVYDVPEYQREQGVAPDSSKARDIVPGNGAWTADGRYYVMDVRALDNKDRWLVRYAPATGDLTVLDRQRDEAWIAGPGLGWFFGGGTFGLLPDGQTLYFQSEADGYSHLYTLDVATGRKTQLTQGDYEVFDPQLSRDGRHWYYTSSDGSPFERHLYRMNLDGAGKVRLTSMVGNNDAALSPDAEMMGVRFSFTNQPPELYWQAVETDGSPAAPVQITRSVEAEWAAYPWRTGEIIHFEASDGVDVPAQVLLPENPNGAAVLFVHGAGYLQNVHRWWSSYFREYMFHNLLTDLGYVVMNVDYRASSGYGRDWRTAIYRHMGGRDLQDYVDASRYLQREHGIDAERIGIYGGSYGGFITLMALFTAPEHFGAGAALRSVTDWAHYNHGYTSNILNTPAEDSLAIARSSPIYFAEGLEDPLLIAHGMIDTNVQFQDVVRLAQRLIELGKTDWEMAVYPIEGHGFTEPASWTDEYRRILELFERHIGPDRCTSCDPRAVGQER